MIDTDKGFTIERVFDATPQQIWNAWTNADEAAGWWHPRGLSTPRESVEIDARVGGRYRYTMLDEASGEEFPTGGVYRDVVALERLTLTWGEPDANPDDAPVVTVTIASAGELTRMTFELRGVDGEPGDESFYDGWDQALDSLAEHLGQMEVRG